MLAAEILSPSTRSVGLVLKRALYEEAGVDSYWVADPVEPSIRAWELRDGAHVEAGRAVGADALRLMVSYDGGAGCAGGLIVRAADRL